MAPRGIQNKDALRNNRLKRISKLKAQIAQLEKQGGTGKGSFRTKNKISQLKKTLRDIGGGYQKTKTYKTEKKEVKTSRGLKIRNVSTVKPKKDKKMSNIPVGEGYVNNPNYGKKPKKTESNTSTESSNESSTESSSNGSSSKTENKIDTKTAFSQEKSLLDKDKTESKKKDSLKIKKGSARNFIKTKKGFARRGTPMAKRAEERERKRKALAAKGYMKNK